MSNWRINFGMGPVRYSRQINAPKPKPEQKPMTVKGCLITLVVTVVLVYLCCWGGVAWMTANS
ncbi:hypothetical protein [Micromonospora avicenniae]|uniref:Uncharacterized protein n=1 Tax=Micromonospora avicenniae TaxID=1198245 RepID=A0A1N7CNY2_9ACTN|nr:hypothetical protein [Micromonospora avicenniae]SIR65318.1 hypothetical protein SAMN05444858_113186 [Micromonospora avicenniae]